jgi:endonuclease YncB( thermonuclease family)
VLGLIAVGLLAYALVVPAYAETLSGRITHVTDGDTLTLVTADLQKYVVRLAGIDAPERNQPFGSESRDHLTALTLDKAATVESRKQDRYGRLVGKVVVEGVDVNLALLRAGLAWHYTEYQSEQSVVDLYRYAAEELIARTAKRGLWGTPTSVPPWQWRQMTRTP